MNSDINMTCDMYIQVSKPVQQCSGPAVQLPALGWGWLQLQRSSFLVGTCLALIGTAVAIRKQLSSVACQPIAAASNISR